MVGWILNELLSLFLIVKFYKNREIFKQLSKKEWLQGGGGFLVAWAVAILIIIGGSNFTDAIQIVWLSKVFEVVLILIGLGLAGYILHKTLPEKLKELYS
ncbi:hypothetical protein A9986_10145 [Solibacillus silvestris]|nr:hypothetical protein [Solibacillus silvestris]OBW57096.1 hypothetical protein A9986_10145 [Solibacillus silvestris]